MNVSPKLKAARFADVKVGTLLVFETLQGCAIGLAVAPSKTKGKCVLSFGSASQQPSDWQVMDHKQDECVLCFPDYTVRLPPAGWTLRFSKDMTTTRLLLLCADKLHIRLKDPTAGIMWIDLASGTIQSGLPTPVGASEPLACTRSWSLWTNEDRPQEILSFA
jgi:hypothetical protein